MQIPFLFHCGETLDVGTDTDGNLVDALVLGSKRIGHGFALPRHPGIMRMMKERNVCVEVCPISNEILGLTPRISGHAVYSLLAENMPCTINTDNGTLFRYVILLCTHPPLRCAPTLFHAISPVLTGPFFFRPFLSPAGPGSPTTSTRSWPARRT